MWSRKWKAMEITSQSEASQGCALKFLGVVCIESPIGDLLKGLNRDVIGPYVCLGTFSGVYRKAPKGADVKQKQYLEVVE